MILLYIFKLKNINDFCTIAMNGKQAVQIITENIKDNKGQLCEYSLILMDCNMPILDGYEASKKIRSECQANRLLQPVIVAITGHTEDSYLQKAYESGMN